MFSIAFLHSTVILFHLFETAFESVQKECGGEKIRATAGRDAPTDKLLSEFDQCCIALWASGATKLDDTSGTLAHDPLCLSPPSIENTGVIEMRHDRKQGDEPAVPLCLAALASFLQCRKPYFDNVRKIRMGFAASAGGPMSFQNNIAVRYHLWSCTIRQTREIACSLGYKFRTGILTQTCSTNQ